MSPSLKSAGVVGVLVVKTSPESERTPTTSVNVPPVSMPMRSPRLVVMVSRSHLAGEQECGQSGAEKPAHLGG